MNVALIMAGGTGFRMHSSEKKQFMDIEGKPLIVHTMINFISHPDIDQLIVVVPEEDKEKMKKICHDEFAYHKVMVTSGGEKRQISVLNGLRNCPSDTKFVLIHDGVRPFVTRSMIFELLKLVTIHRAVIPCSPVRYTLKRVSENKITGTIDRHDIYKAQTPQVFDFQLIYDHHQKALKTDITFTDDSSILEYYGIPVYLLTCSDYNFKITEPADLELARLIIRNRQAEKFWSQKG